MHFVFTLSGIELSISFRISNHGRQRIPPSSATPHRMFHYLARAARREFLHSYRNIPQLSSIQFHFTLALPRTSKKSTGLLLPNSIARRSVPRSLQRKPSGSFGGVKKPRFNSRRSAVTVTYLRWPFDSANTENWDKNMVDLRRNKNC